MAPFALYGIIGLVVASLVIAFFSARTWHWGHVLVVVGIVLATFGFIILSAEVLRINSVYRSAIDRKTDELRLLTENNNALEKGTENSEIIARLQAEQEPAVAMPENAESIPSLDDLDHQILLATRLRGRVWRNVAPAGIDASGVTIQAPSLAGLDTDTVVYLFEEGPAQLPAADGRPQGKQYLGEFRIQKGQAPNQPVKLTPVQPLDQFEQQRLASSKPPWVIYETMPADRYAIFAGMTEEELKQKLPPQSVQEYVRHGKEATADDDETRQVGYDADGKRLPPEELPNAAKRLYQRRLRDYATEFDELSRRRVAMEVATADVKESIKRIETSLASAKDMQAAKEREVQQLNSDLTGIKKERQAIETHLALVQQQLNRARQLLDAALKRNTELARQLAADSRGAANPTVPLALDATK
jgi:hypothetical protein